MTKGIVVKTKRGSYILSDPELGSIQNESDILEMMTLSGEVETHKLLVSSGSLDQKFFHPVLSPLLDHSII